MEPQIPGPVPGTQFDFIMNPQKAPKKSMLAGGPGGGNPFVKQIMFLIGGAVLLMIVIALGINFIFGGKTDMGAILSIAQTEQEIVRVSLASKDATDQSVKNAAVNTELTVGSHQQAWLKFLASHRTKTDAKLLALKRDNTTDAKFTAAQQTSTFNSTFANTMRSQLEAYAEQLKSAYDGASNKQERQMLKDQYGHVQLLLKQWPSSVVGLAFY
ncbi:MAG TPA: hypothetical protein VL737_04620 [Candidatus Pristimantibacillus sp.]|jgi:hypothetical protein|nr:hypothetical protein [Candidatus Pristimantibacillus sp.]